MKRLLQTGCGTGAIAVFLFLGTASLHAQAVRAVGNAPGPAAKAGTANANLYRGNLARTVRQPMPMVKGTTNPMSNGMFPGMGQPGMNQGYYPGMNQSYYPGMNQGYYPGMNQGYFPGMNQGYFPGYYQNMNMNPFGF